MGLPVTDYLSGAVNAVIPDILRSAGRYPSSDEHLSMQKRTVACPLFYVRNMVMSAI